MQQLPTAWDSTDSAVSQTLSVSEPSTGKIKLAWRKSGGARRSLGWIPFKDRSVVYRGGQLHFQG